MEDTTDTTETAAARFGTLVARLATEAGYDLTSGSGGRKVLAEAAGMSPSAVSRMVSGETLPRPDQFEGIARAVKTDVRTLLVEARVISANSWPSPTNADVGSPNHPIQPLTPEVAADAWGIDDPMIRGMLISGIEQAIRLQHERNHGASGGARAKG